MSKEKEVISLEQALKNKNLDQVIRAINSDNCEIVIDAKYPGRQARNYANDSLALAIATKNEKIVGMVLQKAQELEIKVVVNDAKYPNGKLNYFHNTIYKALQTKNEEMVDLVLRAGADPKTLENQYPGRQELIDKQLHLKESQPSTSPSLLEETIATQISAQGRQSNSK